MITVEGEKIEVIDAHSHMGARKKLAIHQIPPIMKWMAEDEAYCVWGVTDVQNQLRIRPSSSQQSEQAA